MRDQDRPIASGSQDAYVRGRGGVSNANESVKEPSKEPGNVSFARALKLVVWLSSGLCALLGILDLVGWLAAVPVLETFSTRFVPMAPGTAVDLLAASLVLPFGNRRRARVAQSVVFTFICLVALSEIVELLGHFPVSIESLTQYLLPFAKSEHLAVHVVKRMSAVSAVLFLVIGLSRIGWSRTKVIGDFQGLLGIIPLALGILVAIGYAYGTPFLYAGPIAPLALTTGFGMVFLGVSLCVAAGVGNLPLRLVAGSSARARMLRAFLPGIPAAILLDALLEALLPTSMPAVAVSLFGVIFIVVVSGSIVIASHALGRAMDRAVVALSERERELRAIFNGTGDALLIADDEGTFIDANRPAYYLFGLAPHNLLGLRFDDLLARHETDVWTRFLRLRHVRAHTHVSLNDGSERELEYSLTAGILPGRHLVVVRDITDSSRKALESERLAAIVASSFDAIYSKDLHGTIVSWNPSARRIFGYSPREMIGRTEEVLFGSSGSEAEEPNPSDTKEEREVIATGKDGRRINVTLSESPIHDVVGRAIGTSVIARDVTAHRQAEQELQQSERRFMVMFEYSPVAIGLAERNSGRLLAVNGKWCELLGYEREEVVGRTAFELRLWTDLTDRDRLVGQLSHHSQFAYLEAEVRRKSGEVRLALVSMTMTTLADTTEEVIIVTLVDTTDRRELELQLIQSQKMEAVGRLAGGVAHDFNNLLGVILGFSELLDKTLPENDRRKIEQIAKAANRAAGLTSQLLAFSRKQLLEPKVLNLNDLVAGTATMLKRLIGEDIILQTAFGDQLGSVRADPGQLEQVVMNLAVNARDAMPRGGTLTIRTENSVLDEGISPRHEPVVPGPYVQLSVSDTGSGMDRETLEHLFEPFFTTKEHGKGTGLGLSTVYGIIKQSSGYVWVYSEIGRGSTFKVYLPRVDLPTEEPVGGEEHADLSGTETILLAEDEASLRSMISEVLTEKGYTVLTAEDGPKAFETARREQARIQLLITDVVMPGMGGPELAETLVGMDPELKVLFISGYTADVSPLDDLPTGKTRLLSKPFTNNTLLVRVRQLLDEPA